MLAVAIAFSTLTLSRVSSEKSFTLDLSPSIRSLMNIKISRDSSTEPCGTPAWVFPGLSRIHLQLPLFPIG